MLPRNLLVPAVLLSFGVAACEADKPKPPASRAPVVAAAPAAAPDAGEAKPAREVPGLLAKLRTADVDQRDAALQRLRELAEADALSGVDAVELLRAAGEEWPEGDGDADVGAVLVELASRKPRVTFVPVVQRAFPKLSPPAKERALELLASLDDDRAATAMMSLLAAHAGELSGLSLAPLRRKPHHAQIFFPALLGYAAREELAWEVWLTALSYCQAGDLGEGELAPYAPHMLDVYRHAKAKLFPLQRGGLRSSALSVTYREYRAMAELLLDLFAYVPGRDVEPELRQALSYRDPRLLLFAATSLRHRGEEVPQSTFDRVAASPDSRNWLYRRLANMDELDRFPERYASQLAFAESEMVEWLLDPSELGCNPDDIVLGKIVSVDSQTPDGPLDFYVFRFRTRPPHWAASRGWLAGVAGPFLRKDAPTLDSIGYAFSSFEAWSSRTPEEHVGDVTEIVKFYQARRAQEREAGEEESGSEDD